MNEVFLCVQGADPFAGLGALLADKKPAQGNKGISCGQGVSLPSNSSLLVGIERLPGMLSGAATDDPFAGIGNLAKPTTPDPFANLEGLSAIATGYPKSKP